MILSWNLAVGFEWLKATPGGMGVEDHQEYFGPALAEAMLAEPPSPHFQPTSNQLHTRLFSFPHSHDSNWQSQNLSFGTLLRGKFTSQTFFISPLKGQI